AVREWNPQFGTVAFWIASSLVVLSMVRLHKNTKEVEGTIARTKARYLRFFDEQDKQRSGLIEAAPGAQIQVFISEYIEQPPVRDAIERMIMARAEALKKFAPAVFIEQAPPKKQKIELDRDRKWLALYLPVSVPNDLAGIEKEIDKLIAKMDAYLTMPEAGRITFVPAAHDTKEDFDDIRPALNAIAIAARAKGRQLAVINEVGEVVTLEVLEAWIAQLKGSYSADYFAQRGIRTLDAGTLIMDPAYEEDYGRLRELVNEKLGNAYDTGHQYITGGPAVVKKTRFSPQMNKFLLESWTWQAKNGVVPIFESYYHDAGRYVTQKIYLLRYVWYPIVKSIFDKLNPVKPADVFEELQKIEFQRRVSEAKNLALRTVRLEEELRHFPLDPALEYVMIMGTAHVRYIAETDQLNVVFQKQMQDRSWRVLDNIKYYMHNDSSQEKLLLGIFEALVGILRGKSDLSPGSKDMRELATMAPDITPEWQRLLDCIYLNNSLIAISTPKAFLPQESISRMYAMILSFADRVPPDRLHDVSRELFVLHLTKNNDYEACLIRLKSLLNDILTPDEIAFINDVLAGLDRAKKVVAGKGPVGRTSVAKQGLDEGTEINAPLRAAIESGHAACVTDIIGTDIDVFFSGSADEVVGRIGPLFEGGLSPEGLEHLKEHLLSPPTRDALIQGLKSVQGSLRGTADAEALKNFRVIIVLDDEYAPLEVIPHDLVLAHTGQGRRSGLSSVPPTIYLSLGALTVGQETEKNRQRLAMLFGHEAADFARGQHEWRSPEEEQAINGLFGLWEKVAQKKYPIYTADLQEKYNKRFITGNKLFTLTAKSTEGKDCGTITIGRAGQVIPEQGSAFCNYMVIYDTRKDWKKAAVIHTHLSVDKRQDSDMIGRDARKIITDTLVAMGIDPSDKEYIRRNVSIGIARPEAIGRGPANEGRALYGARIERYLSGACLELGLPEPVLDMHFYWSGQVRFFVDEGVLAAVENGDQARQAGMVRRLPLVKADARTQAAGIRKTDEEAQRSAEKE
ncbi:MAG: hypothetical protein PHS37_09985, partial [Candidatus Omnitrophica bacterium]|nr:hypothetical protein [Candidatus Omnitrophota bacterium]